MQLTLVAGVPLLAKSIYKAKSKITLTGNELISQIFNQR
jgi:hypothetical protein